MRTTGIGLFILATTLLAATTFGGEPMGDNKSIQGTWSVFYAVFEGKRVPRAEIQKVEIVITAGKISLGEKGKESNVWRYQLDSSKKPKSIDVVLKTFKLRPRGDAVEVVMEKMLGIYELKGDDLRIALSKGISMTKDPKDQPEADKSIMRPSSFEHGPNVVGVLMLKRTGK
jgi:uncharacterized protein (TIGR03067 family)